MTNTLVAVLVGMMIGAAIVSLLLLLCKKEQWHEPTDEECLSVWAIVNGTAPTVPGLRTVAIEKSRKWFEAWCDCGREE